jgi:hypothetical protein
MEPSRVLTEGGPFTRRVNLLLDWLIGVTIALVGIVVGGCLVALSAHSSAGKATTAVSEVQAGRTTGSQITCGTNQATLRATQRLIESASAPKTTPLQEHEIERLGFGSRAQRKAQAHMLGIQFVLYVRQEIGSFAGPKARAVIEIDAGGLARVNCAKLKQITKVH